MSRDCTALVALAGLAPDRRLRVASVLASPLQLQTIVGARSRFGSLSLASPRSLAVTHETPEIGSWQAPDPTLIKKRGPVLSRHLATKGSPMPNVVVVVCGRRTDGRVCAYGDAQRRAGAYRRLIHWSRPTLRWFRRAFGTGIGGSAAGSTISRSRGTNVCLHPATSPPAHGRRARRAGLLLIRQDQNYPQNQAASTRPMSQDTPPPRVRRDLSSWSRGTRSSHTGTRFCRPRSGTCSRRSLPRPRACRAARR